MTKILQATMSEHRDVVHDLFAEYLRWVCARIHEEYQAVFDPEPMIVHDMEAIDIFLPPKGLLLVAFENGFPAGCACARTIGDRIAELKRMYIRPIHRRKGIGGALLREILQRVKQWNYAEIRLDSAAFMADAHRVYESHGFREVPPYAESEIPVEYRKYWIFMALKLEGT
jgi:GNAT superfamily N-acetyltransferase